MNKVEAYIAGAKELLALDSNKDRALYYTLDDQLCDMWDDMSEKERTEATSAYRELREGR